MDKVKSTVGTKILGYSIMVMVLFAVLFDPTEMALGAKYVTLSASALTLAEVIGNFTWVFGVLYMVVAFGAGCVLFTDEALDGALKDTSTFKALLPKWYKTLLSYVSIVASLITIGSGFWFVGVMWFLAMLMLKGMLGRIRKSDKYKAWHEEYKAG